MESLKNINQFNSPFNYFTSDCVFSSNDALKIFSYLLELNWRLHVEDFFQQYEFKIKPCDEISKLITNYGFVFKGILEKQFDVLLDNLIEIDAHMLIPGQKISIHNDSPKLGFEAYRLAVNLNKNYDDKCGGHFYILSGYNSNAIEKIIRPTFNSGVGFQAANNSYHAIGKVLKTARYSIVFSYYHIGNTGAIKDIVLSTLNDLKNKYHSDISVSDQQLLLLLKTNEIKNTYNSLYDHFIDTYCLLRHLGESEEICRLGLFHSILGTKNFDFKTKVDLYQFLDLNFLELLNEYSSFDIINFSPNIKNHQQLVKVYYANLFTSMVNYTFSKEHWNEEKEFLIKNAKYFPKNYFWLFKEIYQLDNSHLNFFCD